MAMTYGIREPEEELKTAGLKATAPRMKILEIFQRAQQNPEERHLSAEDIYKQLLKENLDVGLATVYRVLTQFEAAGILVRHHFGSDRATYEMDDGDHHDHIVWHALRSRGRVCGPRDRAASETGRREDGFYDGKPFALDVRDLRRMQGKGRGKG